jgi:hypothetical protein
MSKPTLAPDTYAIVRRAVEEGAAYGWRRAHKHGRPTEEAAIDAIADAVMGAICEVVRFPEPP